MKLLTRLFNSSVGLKLLMGGSGVLIFLWVVIHMLGNLQLFMGAKQLNEYAKLLKWSPEVLWAARLGLLGLAALHVYASLKLTFLNNAARPTAYQEIKYVKASLASRTMIYTGLLLLAFVGFHLWQFTISEPATHLPMDHEGMLDVYTVVVQAFRNPLNVAIYVIGVALVGFHLTHGAKSWFRSLGLSNPAYSPFQETFALVAALVVFLGFAAVPLAVFFLNVGAGVR